MAIDPPLEISKSSTPFILKSNHSRYSGGPCILRICRPPIELTLPIPRLFPLVSFKKRHDVYCSSVWMRTCTAWRFHCSLEPCSDSITKALYIAAPEGTFSHHQHQQYQHQYCKSSESVRSSAQPRERKRERDRERQREGKYSREMYEAQRGIIDVLPYVAFPLGLQSPKRLVGPRSARVLCYVRIHTYAYTTRCSLSLSLSLSLSFFLS